MMKVYKAILAGIFALFLLRNLRVPNGYEITIGDCEPPMCLNYFIWFVCNDLMFILCAIGFALCTRLTLAYLFLWITVGKLVQEFVSPYGYGWFELMWDTIGLCIAIILIVYNNLKDVPSKRNHTIKAN